MDIKKDDYKKNPDKYNARTIQVYYINFELKTQDREFYLSNIYLN